MLQRAGDREFDLFWQKRPRQLTIVPCNRALYARDDDSPILAKWALSGYEGGAAGLPLADAAPFATLGGNSGQQQRFFKGVIYGASAGPRA